MSLPVALLPAAAADINELADRAAHYSPAARTKLLVAVADRIQLLERYPEMYQLLEQYPPLRRCVVTPTVSLYYRIQPAVVEIVGIIDSRRDPEALGLR